MKKSPTVFGNKVVYAGMRNNLSYHKSRKAARLRKEAARRKDGLGFQRKLEYDHSLPPSDGQILAERLSPVSTPTS